MANRDNMDGVPYIELSAEQMAAMQVEYSTRGTSTCPLCGERSQPWNGIWFCVCGAIAVSRDRPEGVGMEEKVDKFSVAVEAIQHLGTEAGKRIPAFRDVLNDIASRCFVDPEQVFIDAMEQLLLLARQADAAQIEKLKQQLAAEWPDLDLGPDPTPEQAVELKRDYEAWMAGRHTKDQQIAALERRVEGLESSLRAIVTESAPAGSDFGNATICKLARAALAAPAKAGEATNGK